MISTKRKRLGEVLLEKRVITEDQLRIALTEQKRTPSPIGKLIVGLGFVTEAVMRDVLGEALGQESIELASTIPDPDALRLIPKEMARSLKLIPLSYDLAARELSLATVDTYDLPKLDRLRAHIGAHIQIRTVLAGEAEIENAIDQFYGHELSMDGILQEVETGEIDYDSLQAHSGQYSHPMVRLVDAMLSDAVKRGASDVHFEPEDGFLRIRYRIDGVLRQVRSLHKHYYSAIAVRIKVIAALNIAETRAPQDGHVSLTIAGRHVDFRVSTQLTTHGENIVLRVLDRQKAIVPLTDLGYSEDALATMKLMMARPEGIILITGPTGSGKTTTLYSILNNLNSERVNIMTLEDPVEYPMPMIRQSSVNEAARLDFANGIRSIMRQDPDIILVGEIRDRDTADMAFRAAMTGHQVYSTLHTNSAPGAIPRLLDIGVLPDILAGNIIGVVAQRLVRRLCKECKTPDNATDAEKHLLKLPLSETFTVYRAKGCRHCDHQGYRGREAMAEVLRFDGDLEEMVAHRATRRELMQLALTKGYRPLVEQGLEKVRNGITTLEEVARVVDLTALQA
ncbi:MAG: type II/IV secretion system protein [Gammaproteobacteria bacterium]|nr:type II/IV secretion system protein [Gammaproteobacteria bacterium]